MSGINLLKNNAKREWSDLEWVEEFYEFLQGAVPNTISLARGHKVKLTPNKAMAVIWYLQEHFAILPDTIEKCDTCHDLYDSSRSGYYSEIKKRFYCNSCMPPFIDEKEEKILELRAKRHRKESNQ